MRGMKSLLLCAVVLVGGCKDAHQLHQPGPIIALYQKDGGPAYQTSSTTYDRVAVEKFFETHPDVIDSFINHGVCSQISEQTSDEATQNGMICSSATSASMKRSLQRNIDANK